MIDPVYDVDGITIYHADCADVLPLLKRDDIGAVIMDPPYGIDYASNKESKFKGVGIKGDSDTRARDDVLAWWNGPAAAFGSWKQPIPDNTAAYLVWEKTVGGMGDLSMPWSPSWEAIFILGKGWMGHSGSSVLRAETVVTWSSKPWQRKHPNEKPVGLMRQLVEKAPPGIILDPYMGSGPVARACADLGRRYIGIEIVEEYVDAAIGRLGQMALMLEGSG